MLYNVFDLEITSILKIEIALHLKDLGNIEFSFFNEVKEIFKENSSAKPFNYIANFLFQINNLIIL